MRTESHNLKAIKKIIKRKDIGLFVTWTCDEDITMIKSLLIGTDCSIYARYIDPNVLLIVPETHPECGGSSYYGLSSSIYSAILKFYQEEKQGYLVNIFTKDNFINIDSFLEKLSNNEEHFISYLLEQMFENKKIDLVDKLRKIKFLIQEFGIRNKELKNAVDSTQRIYSIDYTKGKIK